MSIPNFADIAKSANDVSFVAIHVGYSAESCPCNGMSRQTILTIAMTSALRILPVLELKFSQDNMLTFVFVSLADQQGLLPCLSRDLRVQGQHTQQCRLQGDGQVDSREGH
jgi:transketolase C-terminal domain/subunit